MVRRPSGPQGVLSPLLRGLLAALLVASPAFATSLVDIRRLEELIRAAGTETLVSDHCPSTHAGYYENDGRTVDRLVVCSNTVDLSDLDAVWEVMAHESTHIMQSCTGAGAIADTYMPRTYRELQALAPHYAKLLDQGYRRADQRLEAEAFWMELQTPETVLELFRRNCGRFLGAPRRSPAAAAPAGAPAQPGDGAGPAR